jgi:hypothetical protein
LASLSFGGVRLEYAVAGGIACGHSVSALH